MAVTSVVLDIRANTDRALNEFKRFSSQLDNKFLVSGLKLDVVRSALGQINREFQKAIGEQGLQAGQSLRAAQNQAALLTRTFQGFSSAASMDIATQFSSAFNEVAIKAGGTAQDIQKALAATPFISTDLSEDMRKALGQGVLTFQRDFRRAGLGEDFSGIARQFLMGQLSAQQMINSGDAAQAFLGNQLARSTGTVGLITNAQQRSEALLNIVQDPAFNKQLTEMARRAYGFRAIIEDLNTRLFNPEKGIFGSLRQVTMSVRDKTTIFDETEKLINSVFGQQGLFVNFFKQIGKIFGIEDPLKAIIIGIRFVTRQFDRLNAFIQSPEVQGIVKKLQEVFNTVKDFATSLYSSVTETFSNPIDIDASIKGIGKQIREFIENVGKSIREANVEEQGTKFLNTFTILVGEVAQTLGTAIKEAILVVFSGKGLAVLGGAVKVLYEGLSKFFTGLFGGNQGAGAVLGGAAMAALGVLFVRRIRGALESILRPIQALGRGGGGVGGFVNRLLGGGGSNADPDLNPMTGRAAFQGQVIARMDAIIRILAGGGATDIDYGGPSSPVDGGPRRGRRGGGGGGDDDSGGGGGGGRSRRRSTRGRRPYYGPIGPLPHNSAEPWEGEDLPYMTSDGRRTDARGLTTRERFNRRYGRRGQLRRGMREFGRGALLTGAVLAAGSIALNAGPAFSSQGGEGNGEAPEVGAGEAWGQVGIGAAQGGLMGAQIGSVIPGVGTALGAGLGAAIGAGVTLFDKGIRDAISKSIGWFTTGTLSNTKKLWDGLVSNVMKTFDGIKSFAGSIDWKNVLLDTFLPGRALIRAGAEAAGLSRETKDEGPLGGLKNWLLGAIGMKEAGGTVIRGTSYIVGERGPEIFTPGATGSISSNRDLMAMRSGGSTSPVSANFNITIQVNGNMGAGDVEMLRGPVLRIVEEAWASATQGTVSRGSMA
jgi:hypothetical protein